MSKAKVILVRLEDADRNQFILDNQEAFRYGATEEFGLRDDHFGEDGEIISRETIEHDIDEENAEAYRIVSDGQKVGGAVIRIDKEKLHGDLDLLFVSPHVHSRGIGHAAWRAIEEMHPEVKVWETVTPYFEKRNIHFYVNRCGFHIVEFFNGHHPDPNDPEMGRNQEDNDGMFRFQKVMEKQSQVKGVKATELLRGSKSWDGAEMPDYLVGRPELVTMRYEFAAGEKLGWHHHEVMNYGFLAQGELTIVDVNGNEKVFHAGEALIEMVGTIHRGENRGTEPVVLYMFYASQQGLPLSVQHPEIKQ